MSTSRYVGRHGTARRSPLSRLPSVGAHGTRAVAKTVAGLGIVLGSGAFIIAPSSAAGGPQLPEVTPVAALTAPDTVDDLLDDRSGADETSRSATRTTAAVTAPAADSADAHESVGELAVEPVVKPEPKPEPEPVEAEVTPDEGTEETSADQEQSEQQTDEQSGTESEQAPEQTEAPATGGGPVTGNYASQAAAIGLGANAQRVYSAVRTQFPDMTNIGGYRAGDPGDHGSGNAVDIMVTGARGDQVAAWLQQNAGSLNIKYIIWQQRIWMPGGSWKMMEDRGSPTQNHYDHVHVSVS